jgi:hypothetical protein
MCGSLKKGAKTMSQNQTAADWISRRVSAMNRILKSKGNHRSFHEHFIDEHWRLMNTNCKTKKEYKIWTRANGKV